LDKKTEENKLKQAKDLGVFCECDWMWHR